MIVFITRELGNSCNVLYVATTTAQSLSNANRLVSRADKRVIAHYYNYRCAYINEHSGSNRA